MTKQKPNIYNLICPLKWQAVHMSASSTNLHSYCPFKKIHQNYIKRNMIHRCTDLDYRYCDVSFHWCSQLSQIRLTSWEQIIRDSRINYFITLMLQYYQIDTILQEIYFQEMNVQQKKKNKNTESEY